MARIINKFRWRTILITDNRVRTMNEILNSIKLIKMYAWEESFQGKVAGARAAPSRPGIAPGSSGVSRLRGYSNGAVCVCLRQT